MIYMLLAVSRLQIGLVIFCHIDRSPIVRCHYIVSGVLLRCVWKVCVKYAFTLMILCSFRNHVCSLLGALSYVYYLVIALIMADKQHSEH